MGRWALGEPALVVPRRTVDRLCQLEFRERLRQAEQAGDHVTLDREQARVQLTAADLARLAARSTPPADWPDEDVAPLLGPSAGPAGEPA